MLFQINFPGSSHLRAAIEGNFDSGTCNNFGSVEKSCLGYLLDQCDYVFTGYVKQIITG